MNKRNKKMAFVYSDEGELKTELVWVNKKGEYYQIDNIPFYIKNIAYKDVVDYEIDEGVMYFLDLIEPSGHSTIQVVFFKNDYFPLVTKNIEDMGCSWEESDLKHYISVDIPPEIDYDMINNFFIKQHKSGILDFKEACIGNKTG